MNVERQSHNNSQERKDETTTPVVATERRDTPQTVPAGQWLRIMTGFKAPFGHDGMPTVWG